MPPTTTMATPGAQARADEDESSSSSDEVVPPKSPSTPSSSNSNSNNNNFNDDYDDDAPAALRPQQASPTLGFRLAPLTTFALGKQQQRRSPGSSPVSSASNLAVNTANNGGSSASFPVRVVPHADARAACAASALSPAWAPPKGTGTCTRIRACTKAGRAPFRHIRHSSAATSTTKVSTSTEPPPVPPTLTSSAPASKLPRFLQSPLQRNRSKSLSVDCPPSAASSSNSHSISTSHSTVSSGSSHRSGRFLGLGGGTHSKESSTSSRERKPPLRSERRFSVSQIMPPSSLGHGDAGRQTLQLQRSPSQLSADGPLAACLSGWFARLAGRTSDLSLAGTVAGMLRDSVSTASALASSSSSTSRSKNSKSNGTGNAGVSKTSLLDKALHYLLDGDAAPDRSVKEIWLMGSGWRAEDEGRVAVAASASHGYSHAHTLNHSSASARLHLPLPTPLPPRATPLRAAFHAAFYAQVWCTYRAGFEPIRDLPGPPPLAFSRCTRTRIRIRTLTPPPPVPLFRALVLLPDPPLKHSHLLFLKYDLLKHIDIQKTLVASRRCEGLDLRRGVRLHAAHGGVGAGWGGWMEVHGWAWMDWPDEPAAGTPPTASCPYACMLSWFLDAPAVPLRPFVPPPPTTHNGMSALALAHDMRCSLSPEVHVCGQEHGRTLMAEDELLYAPCRAPPTTTKTTPHTEGSEGTSHTSDTSPVLSTSTCDNAEPTAAWTHTECQSRVVARIQRFHI
ncbi:hypothetical protein B0H11DRAFT_2368337 [Mycena galericulata]|nr:hypothetical protein B0H11DRAFT_2368337 [Mycena galericulata]